jgi:adenylosuccinate lyase
MHHDIPNILAQRYATPEMKKIWSTQGKIIQERQYWIAVMKAQKKLGLAIPDDAIKAYEAVKDNVDIDSINARETVTRHDVKARIEEFNELAQYQYIHIGLTSRDLTENVEQLQILHSLKLIHTKTIASLIALSQRATEFKHLIITARTHNEPAQPTTFGKRLAMFGEELLLAVQRLSALIDNYQARGLKGAVGTQLDALTLFEGNTEKATTLEKEILQSLDIPCALKTVGQVYPRSIDFEVVSALCQTASAPSSFAKTLRLMAGHQLANEGFAQGQVGSSAMPHKMNSRSCERINGFAAILKGHLTMAAQIAGDQWNEGDVSCSVVRRVFLPDSFFAIDGLLETFLTILKNMQVYSQIIERENNQYLPFLITTTILMEAVKAGAGRESAHQAIKEHATAIVKEQRTQKTLQENNLLACLATDNRVKLNLKQLQAILAQPERLTGAAAQQVDAFVQKIDQLKKSHPEAITIQAKPII